MPAMRLKMLAPELKHFYGQAIVRYLGFLVLYVGEMVWAQNVRFPNSSYPEEELYQIISPQMTNLHLNQPSAIGGHLVLAGNGDHEIWEISDPRSPNRVSILTSPHQDGEAESHQVTYGKLADGRTFFSTTSGLGIDIFEITDPENPRLSSSIELPNIFYGDVARAVWGVAWQGNFIYVGATTFGLYVVNVEDPENPVHVATLSRAQLGNVAAGPLFALGDLLVITTPKNLAGVATVDIRDPLEPKFLDAEILSSRSYSGGFYGTEAILLTPFRRFDVTSNPRDIRLVSSLPIPPSEYMSFSNDELFLGGLRRGFEGIYHYDISDPQRMAFLGRIQGRDRAIDDQFTYPIGNLAVMADDTRLNGQFIGAVLAVHDTEPDTSPLTIKATYPVDGTTNVSRSGQIAVSFAEPPDLERFDSSTFIFRPVGGAPIPGRWGCNYTVVTFVPEVPLAPSTQYEFILPAGGVTDLVGNALPETETVTFTTAANDLGLNPGDVISPPVEVATTATLEVNEPDPELLYEWTLEDGTELEGTSVSHVYQTAGRITGTLTTRNPAVPGESVTRAFTQVVYNPIAPEQPKSSSPLILTDSLAISCHPDNDKVSVVSLSRFEKENEFSVGDRPVSVAEAPDGSIWILCRDSHTIYRFEPDSGSPPAIHRVLPYASDPAALCFSPDGSYACVTLRATAQLLMLDPFDGSTSNTLEFPDFVDGQRPTPEALAIGGSIFVTQAISPDQSGIVYLINPNSFTVETTIPLEIDQGPDTTTAGRGLPNYLHGATLSPDLSRLWVAAKKDNIERGGRLDGLELTHDQTVRALTMSISTATSREVLTERRDYDNRDRCHSVIFSPLGDLAFVTLPGNDAVEVVVSTTSESLTTLETDSVPVACQIDAERGLLFVLNFLGRSLEVFDVSSILQGGSDFQKIIRVDLLRSEGLSLRVLRGKKLFYSAGEKLNEAGYMSCASCHLDGSHDGRTYDFSSLGEGFRNTTDLRGRAGTGHGRLHWTGNFDEIQDFEGQLRDLGSASGLMADQQFFAGTRHASLGDAKAGLSADLDDLAAYVESLTTFPPSPFRQPDGDLTPSGMRGRQVFLSLNCQSCHGGNEYTDSPSGARHNVGTATERSGERLGGTLDGFDTPTLRGIWETGPYLHDGSAPTLLSVFQDRNPSGLHGATSTLTKDELNDLVSFLLQLDGNEAPVPLPSSPDTNRFENFIVASGLTDPTQSGPFMDPDGDGVINLMEFAQGGSDPTSGGSLPDESSVHISRSETNEIGATTFSWLVPKGGVFSSFQYTHGGWSYQPELGDNLNRIGFIFRGWAPSPGELPQPPDGYRWISKNYWNAPRVFGRLKVMEAPRSE